MYIRIGFLGHAFTIHFGPEEEDDGEEFGGRVGGGSGGSFERCVDVDTDFMESDEMWEEEDRARFGFC
jgi:hypothetical protein